MTNRSDSTLASRGVPECMRSRIRPPTSITGSFSWVNQVLFSYQFFSNNYLLICFYCSQWLSNAVVADKGMVLLPSDSETLNANDWLLLESFLRQDGENDAEETIVTDTIITERQASTSRDFFGHESMPWWMWCFPIVMFIIALWDCHIDSSASEYIRWFSGQQKDIVDAGMLNEIHLFSPIALQWPPVKQLIHLHLISYLIGSCEARTFQFVFY